MKNNTRYLFFTTALILLAAASFAQRDTTKRQTIDITSSYKPVLRNAVKINFSATNLNADTSKSVMPYNIPQQNLFYAYQAIPLKPLALAQDSTLELGIRNFIKVGFGNYTTPYASAGLSFGDGKKALLNLYGDFIASKSNIANQEYMQANFKAAGSYFTKSNELYGSAALSQHTYHLYGYDHALYNYVKSDVRQRFLDVSVKAGFRNKNTTETGINYNPNIQLNHFNIEGKANETSGAIEVPLSRTFAEVFTIKLAGKADITSYTSKALASGVSYSNNIFSVSPELMYSHPSFIVHAGVTPTWDNGKLAVFPNIYGEAKIKDKIFLVEAGFTGRFIKNTYNYLSNYNSYLQTPGLQQNTKEQELYAGIKATVGKHFNFSAKAGILRYSNLPLFLNDSIDGKTFYVSNEGKINDLRIHADMSFISQDKFTITGGLTFNGYTGMQNNARAWGTIPLDVNASLRWWAFEKLLIKSDFRLFSGSPYLLNGIEKTLSGGADLSAGAELAITKKFSAWLDVNNIFNNKYERWKNYNVFGLNVLAGVIYKF